MNTKRHFYCVLDTETCTLPEFVNATKNIKGGDKVGILKPIVYDIGWVIVDRKENTYVKRNYLIQETFFVPQVFNTAYYANKRPIYLQKLEDGEIEVDVWKNVINLLFADLLSYNVKAVCAYNAAFDFKKAIPFTEKYIKMLYSKGYTFWISEQVEKVVDILTGGEETSNPEFLIPEFSLPFRNSYPIVDLWGTACKSLINNSTYKKYCLDNKRLTKSAMYFSTSAESTYQYLLKDVDFTEEHTALSDAEIESKILSKALKKGKVEPQITAFPFRNLGTTVDYVKINKKYIPIVVTALEEYAENYCGNSETYLNHIYKLIKELEEELEKK